MSGTLLLYVLRYPEPHGKWVHERSGSSCKFFLIRALGENRYVDSGGSQETGACGGAPGDCKYG